MRRALVLGGGGLIGMGYHAGALKALEEWGLDPAGAELLVGTSAGAVLAGYLRAGWTPADFYDYAHGRHSHSEVGESEQQESVRRLFVPMWHTPYERARRAVGSAFAVASSRGYWRVGGRTPHPSLRRLFPSGMYSTEATQARFHTDLPQEWPDAETYICAVDLYTGKRVVFGAPGAPRANLPDAVLASTAIPGVFPPVRIGARHYVDGGIASATSLDFAVDAGCHKIICIAPLGYRVDEAALTRDPRMWTPVLMRAMFARTLRREVNAARAEGADVLVIRPWLTELKSHGTNSMRHYDRAAVVEAAREGTLRLLADNADHPAVTPFVKVKTKGRAS